MSKYKVPVTFTVPDTIDGVRGLMTATKWEKAGIVYAYTQPEPGKRTDTSQENPQGGEVQFPCSYTEFASLGITGLSNRDTVAFYREQWADAIKKRKAKATKIGEAFDAPTITFPSSEERSGTGIRNRRVTPDNVAEAIKSDPEVAEAAWNAIEEKAIERANDAQLSAIQRGGCVTPANPKPSKLNTAWEDTMVMASRGEALQALEEFVDAIEAGAQRVAANGDPQDNEGAQIQSLANRIADVAATLFNLTLEVAAR